MALRGLQRHCKNLSLEFRLSEIGWGHPVLKFGILPATQEARRRCTTTMQSVRAIHRRFVLVSPVCIPPPKKSISVVATDTFASSRHNPVSLNSWKAKRCALPSSHRPSHTSRSLSLSTWNATAESKPTFRLFQAAFH